MKNTSLFLLSLFSFILIASCNKDDTEVFYWDETSCSDPWQTNYNDTDEEKKANIELYLTDKNIEVEGINFEYDSSKVTFCTACNCTTGNVIGIKVSSKDKEKMEELNFYQ